MRSFITTSQTGIDYYVPPVGGADALTGHTGSDYSSDERILGGVLAGEGDGAVVAARDYVAS